MNRKIIDFKRKPSFPKSKKKIFKIPKSPPKKAEKPSKPDYRYVLVKSTKNRVREFKTREDAIIAKNKAEVKAPGSKYEIIPEKLPKRRFF